jgi:tetratricopeptide (TPR) repeat protein
MGPILYSAFVAEQGSGRYSASVIPVAELPVAALSRPRHTLTVAERVLARSADPTERSYAGHARGIALREIGDVRAAVRQLTVSLQDAVRAGAAREADVAATLAVTLVVAGRSRQGMAQFERALGKVSGASAARIRVRRGSMLGELGRPLEAAVELRAAARTLRRAGDSTWEARALLNLAQAHIEVGDTQHARVALVRAEQLLAGSEHTYEAAVVRQDRGTVAILEGQIAEALTHFDVAEERLAEAGNDSAELSELRVVALLSAGLFGDAAASAEDAVAQLRRPGASAARRAHALVRASEAALAVGDVKMARRRAQEAARSFRRQGLERGRTQARLCGAKARRAEGERSTRLLHELSAVAASAARHRMVEAIEANLLAGELALDVHDLDTARQHLRRAAGGRTNRSYLTRVLGWRAAALQAQASGRRRTLLNACDSGLEVLNRYQLTFGATEARAAATTHGRPLMLMALREAVSTRDAATMLWWVERCRATASHLPRGQGAADAELVALLARLRLTRLRSSEAGSADRLSAGLERQAAELEDGIRRRALRLSAHGTEQAAAQRPDVDRLLADLGETTLLEIFAVDDHVHVLVASADRIAHHLAGSYATALRTARYVEFTLRRTTHRGHGSGARNALPDVSAALERELLGPATAELGPRPVVVVPPAALSSAAWGLLPSLRSRTISVAPSAGSWSAARRRRAARDAVVVVSGPGLRHADSEATAVAERYPRATVLGPGTATSEKVLTALDGASLAHVAAHGAFRNDNPMFSSLLLEDGPLTIFDLQRLPRAPHRLILSCCEAGAVGAAGADEMLGVLSALIPLGTSGLLAAGVPVSDEPAVRFAAMIHDQLLRGDTLAEALRTSRTAAEDDPDLFAVAHAFVAYGAQ